MSTPEQGSEQSARPWVAPGGVPSPPAAGAPPEPQQPPRSPAGWRQPPQSAGTGPPPGWQQPPPTPVPGRPATWQQTPAGGPGWQHLPPEEVARLHRTGVAPLRPLLLSDIFGGALQTMRRNPEATIGMGLIVMAVLLVPSLLGSLAMVRLLTALAPADVELLTLTVNLGFSLLASYALTGMIVHVVGEAVLGDRAGLGATWRAVRSRLPALIGAMLLMGLLMLVGTVVLVLAVVLLVMAVGQTGGGLAVLGIVLVVLVFLGALVLGVWVSGRLTLAPAAVVLERLGPWRAIARAWSLTRGRQGWRVVGITLLAGLVTSLVTFLVQLPLLAVSLWALASGGIDLSPLSTSALVMDHAFQLVIGALVTPFTAGVAALLYLDQRMRREGLDVTLVRAAHDRAARRAR